MLSRIAHQSIFYRSSYSRCFSSRIPDLEWNKLSMDSRLTVRKWRYGLGIPPVVCTGGIMYELGFSTPGFVCGSMIGCIGLIAGTHIGYNKVPEKDMIDVCKSYKELHENILELTKEPLFLKAPDFNVQTLADPIKRNIFCGRHSIVEIFNFWNKSDQLLSEFEEEFKILTDRHKRLLPHVSSDFNISIDPSINKYIEDSRINLQNAMFQIKQAPDWSESLLRYNHEKSQQILQQISLKHDKNSRKLIQSIDKLKFWTIIIVVVLILNRIGDKSRLY